MKCRVVVRATYEWQAQTPDELSIKEGDILLVTDDSDQALSEITVGLVASFTESH